MAFPNKIPPLIVGALLLGAFAILFQTGSSSLTEPDEGRYAEIGREMFVTGDYLFPRLQGAPHYAKPPFTYWAIAGSLSLFGVHEWAARLPSALAALGVLGVVFWLGSAMGGRLTGALGALVLASTGLFLVAARLITTDMLLAFFVALALFLFWRWSNRDDPRRPLPLLFYVVLGLGGLTKGPVAMILVMGIIGVFLVIRKKPAASGGLNLAWGIPLMLLIGFSWFAAMLILNPETFEFFTGGEVRERLFSGRGRHRSWFYHFLWLPVDLWPWTFGVFGAIVYLFQKWRKSRDAGALFLLVWILFPLCFFTLVSSKLPTYLLPMIPPCAIALGWFLRDWSLDGLHAERWKHVGFRLLLASFYLGILLLAVVWVFIRTKGFDDLTGSWTQWIPGGVLFLISVLSVTFISIHLMGRSQRQTLTVSCCILFMGLSLAALSNMDEIYHLIRRDSNWTKVVSILRTANVRGIPIKTQIHPDGVKPRFVPDSEPCFLIYEFACNGLGFYLMGERAEYTPRFGGHSVYENVSDQKREYKLDRADLLELLSGERRVFCLTRTRHYHELQNLLTTRLHVLQHMGEREEDLVLISNQKEPTLVAPR
jgi:4-amino-4-deoxy-L-arabinose transferase-like glycosyltransferase